MECLHDDVNQIIHRMVHRENIKLVHDEIVQRIFYNEISNTVSIKYYYAKYKSNNGFNISIRHDVITGEHIRIIDSFQECIKSPYAKKSDDVNYYEY